MIDLFNIFKNELLKINLIDENLFKRLVIKSLNVAKTKKNRVYNKVEIKIHNYYDEKFK